MGRDFGAGLFEKEVEYLVEHEWARSAEDIIWRRTKLGLFMQDAEIYELECFLKAIKPTRDITPESQVA